MSTPNPTNAKPNVEEIIASIRTRRSPAFTPSQNAIRTAMAIEDNFRGNLAAANQHCRVTAVGTGWRLLYNKLLCKLLCEIIRQINTFHADVVHILNKMMRILEGEDPVVPELSELHRRRITISEMLAERLAQYDALRIEERLEALEKAVFQADHPVK